MHYPKPLLGLIEAFKTLPGVGMKSAERFAFELINWPEKDLDRLSTAIGSFASQLEICDECGAVSDDSTCHFCDVTKRNPDMLCVVATARDLFSFERMQNFKGVYHVLGGVLSPLEGKGPESLDMEKLKKRVERLGVKEVILSLDTTLEGDATALFLKQELSNLPVTVSRLAFGLPMGSSLDYVDSDTLAKAFSGRAQF